MGTHRFVVEPGELSIVRLEPDDAVPEWAARAEGFVSVTRSKAELSIVCPVPFVPDVVRSEGGWTAIKLIGPFPFDQVGVLASIVGPLAESGVSVFAISTFDTDYVLVRDDRLEVAVRALEQAGHVHEGTP